MRRVAYTPRPWMRERRTMYGGSFAALATDLSV
jgi:hypothetical protein